MVEPKRFVVCSDNHGDQEDLPSSRALFKFIDDFNPQIRVHAGDNYDFRNLRKNASDSERRPSMKKDRKMGNDFITRFFSGGETKIFLRGNHDERLWDTFKESTGEVRDHAEDGIAEITKLMKTLGAKMLPYDSAKGIYKIGHLSVLHGYHAGTGACRQHAAIYGNCIFGHVHTQESAPVPSLKPAEARSIGCLCKRDMDYINKKTGKLRWAQGWAYGYLFADGSYQLFMTRKINGHFCTANEIKIY